MADEVSVKDSILNSTKKILGLDASYDVFDLDIITHINSAFFNIKQLGAGPVEGFVIEDENDKWSDFSEDKLILANVKNLVFLKVKMIFDKEATGYSLAAHQELIKEAEWRLNVEAEQKAAPVDPYLELLS